MGILWMQSKGQYGALCLWSPARVCRSMVGVTQKGSPRVYDSCLRGRWTWTHRTELKTAFPFVFSESSGCSIRISIQRLSSWLVTCQQNPDGKSQGPESSSTTGSKQKSTQGRQTVSLRQHCGRHGGPMLPLRISWAGSAR